MIVRCTFVMSDSLSSKLTEGDDQEQSGVQATQLRREVPKNEKHVAVEECTNGVPTAENKGRINLELGCA